MELVYQHLCEWPWDPRHHVDHRFGVLHELGQVRVYVPEEWLVAQAGGPSDVAFREFEERWWRHPREFVKPAPPVVAVVGPYRSGTSCVAGAVHRLGVSMGLDFRALSQPRRFSPCGTWEAPGLARICRQAVAEPTLYRVWPSERVRLEFRRYFVQRAHAAPGKPIGVKHPLLCVLLPELAGAWPSVKVIAVDRTLEAAIASGLNVGWLPTAREVIPAMLAERDRALESLKLPVFRLSYEALLERPREVLRGLCDFLGLVPQSAEFEAAVAFVNPVVRHFGGRAVDEARVA